MHVVTIAIAGGFKDAKLPLPFVELQAIGSQNGAGMYRSFKPDEEVVVAQWILDTDISTLEKPLDDEELGVIVRGEKRSSSDQDRKMANWVLQAWEIIRKHIDA